MTKFVTAILFFIMVLLIGMISPPTHAKTSGRNGLMNRPKAPAQGFSTNHSFEGTGIDGKLQHGNLRKIVVENDKSLEDLLGVRRNFEDREKEERERNDSW
jgi:hypothetical protein